MQTSAQIVGEGKLTGRIKGSLYVATIVERTVVTSDGWTVTVLVGYTYYMMTETQKSQLIEMAAPAAILYIESHVKIL